MKTKKLSPLLATIIAFEMIIAPTAAHAQGLIAALATSMQAYNQTLQAGMPNANMSIDQGLFREQMTPQVDEYFNPAKMSQIPGLVQYLGSRGMDLRAVTCSTLRTSLHEVKFDGCSARPSITGINPAMAVQTADAYRKLYEDVAKTYRNYAEDSTGPGQGFGMGCMRNAITLLNGFFNSRISELDSMAAEIDTVTSKFTEDARVDMNAIEEDTAVLDGGSNELTNNVKTRKPELFDFSKRFNSAECRAIFPLEDYNRMGKAKGLNDINRQLQDKFKDKSGPYSGESYGAAHATILQDINSLAEKVRDQAKLGFSDLASSGNFRNFADGVGSGVTSSESFQVNSSFFANLQTQFSTTSQKYQDELSLLRGELGASGANVLPLITNVDAGGFEEEITTMQSNVENNCVRQTFTGTNSISAVLKRLDSNDSSDFAMKNASNIKPRLEQIMNNPTTSMERKIQQLAEIERETGKRYFLTMDNTYEFSQMENGQAKKVSVQASKSTTPSNYFTNMIRNCQAQFATNFIGNKVTGADAIKRIRALRKNYTNLRNTVQTNMFNEVRRKLINCETPTRANNSVAGSCGPGSFNTSDPKFCANGAFDCASKMKACNAKTEQFVNQIKADRTKRVGQYKDRVEIYRTTLNNLMNAKLKKFADQGKFLNDAFSSAYAAPTPILTQLPEGQRYLDPIRNATAGSPDGELLLEDPVKYAEMIKQNIEKLKGSVVAQQSQIMQQNSPLKNHVEVVSANVFKNVAAQAERFANDCNSGKSFYENVLTEQANQQRQLGEKRNQLCAIYTAGSESGNPQGYCSGNIQDLVSVDAVAVRRLQAYCRRFNNNDENNNSSNNTAQVARICRRFPLPTAAAAPVAPAAQPAAVVPPAQPGAAVVPPAQPAPVVRAAQQRASSPLEQSCWNWQRSQNCRSAPRDERPEDREAREESCSNRESSAEMVLANYEDDENRDDSDDNIAVPQAPAICNAGSSDLTRMADNFLGAGQGTGAIGSASGTSR